MNNNHFRIRLKTTICFALTISSFSGLTNDRLAQAQQHLLPCGYSETRSFWVPVSFEGYGSGDDVDEAKDACVYDFLERLPHSIKNKFACEQCSIPGACTKEDPTFGPGELEDIRDNIKYFCTFHEDPDWVECDCFFWPSGAYVDATIGCTPCSGMAPNAPNSSQEWNFRELDADQCSTEQSCTNN